MTTNKTKVLAGRVSSDVYDQVLEFCSLKGWNPNDFVKNAVTHFLEEATLPSKPITVIELEKKVSRKQPVKPKKEPTPKTPPKPKTGWWWG